MAPARRAVLLAEDDEQVRLLLRAVLEAEGWMVLAVSDGEEAFDLFCAHCLAIVLVVSDIQMPRVGGIELTRRIRQQCPGMKILLISGNFGEDIGALLQELRVEFLRKPFFPTEFVGRVRTMMGPQGDVS